MPSIFISSHLLFHYPFCTSRLYLIRSPDNPRFLSLTKHSCNRLKLGFLHFSDKHGVNKFMCSSGNDQEESDAPTPRKSEPSEWKKWALGIVLSVVLPSFGHKMGPLFLLKSKVDSAIETVEEVIDVAKETAEASELLCDIVEEKLPQDSKLKKEVDVIKNLSEKAVNEAEKAEKALDQVEDAVDDPFMDLVQIEQMTSKKELDPRVKR